MTARGEVPIAGRLTVRAGGRKPVQVATLAPAEAVLRQALHEVWRTAPVELLNVPLDAVRFISENGEVAISFADVDVIRFAAAKVVPRQPGNRPGPVPRAPR